MPFISFTTSAGESEGHTLTKKVDVVGPYGQFEHLPAFLCAPFFYQLSAPIGDAPDQNRLAAG